MLSLKYSFTARVQIMMVPMDGKFFFANDVLRANPTMMSISPQK